MSTKRISLGLSKSRPYDGTVRIARGDVSGTTLVAAIYDGGLAFDLSTATVTLEARTVDGSISLPCTVDGNEVTCTFGEDSFTASAVFAYLKISLGARVLSTARFRIQLLSGDTEEA